MTAGEEEGAAGRRCFLAGAHTCVGELLPAGGREDARDWYCRGAMIEGSRRARWWRSGARSPVLEIGEGQLMDSLKPHQRDPHARVVMA